MSVQCSLFGTLPDGRTAEQWTLSGNGLSVSLINYGAAIQSLTYNGRDMVLGFDRIEDYLSARCPYIGTIVGRYANRLSGGELTLSGRSYPLDCNEGKEVQLHGGKTGLHQKLWTVVENDGAEPSVTMTAVCEDMEGGCPGRMEIRATYSLLPGATLRLEYEAVCDQDTVVNLTSHAFFNLGGQRGDIRGHCLEICASRYLPVDAALIPLGEGDLVEGTPFDFRPANPADCGRSHRIAPLAGEPIGAHLDPLHPQIGLAAGGIDHNFCIDGQGFRPAARVYAPESGITMVCATDQPGLQIYLGQGLCESAGKGGVPLAAYTGLCLETQHYPDSPCRPSYPSTLLQAGDTFRSATEYQFFTNDPEV